MVQDLCVIMLTAGITSLVFKMLKQPVVLGYIVAGILVGPNVLGQSWVSNEESVDTWGQIGVLFLLFALGLEFSFKKLIQVGNTALISAGVIVVGMMSLGFLTGLLFGWNEMNSLFLGGMLCMSSTTIVFKALDDMGLRNHQFAKICFGILVVEDLFAVVLMVLLSSIATTRSFDGKEMLMQIGKLAVYLVLWFVMGIYLLPLFFRRFKKHLNDETLTIFSVGLCLGMVLLALRAGFSSALGAFVMGSVLAETLEAERIEHLVEPVKNIFGSIFFVSVGMMIVPSQLVEYWPAILIITIVVIVGQIVFASCGAILSGQNLKVSIQTGFSLVQIGEFAFIIATLGQSLGVTDPSLYPIVVAVSVITTFLTPFIMRGAEPMYNYVNSRLSDGLRLALENYARNRNTVSMQSTFKRLLRRVILSLFVNGVIVAFFYLIYFRYAAPFLNNMMDGFFPQWLVHTIVLVILLTATSPFIYVMATTNRNSAEATELWNSGTFQRAKLIGITLLRAFVSLQFVAYAVGRIFSITSGMIFAIATLVVLILTFSQRVRKRSKSMLTQFNMNLSAREKSAEAKRVVSSGFTNSLLNYDVHLADFVLPTNSRFCGKTLMQLDVRNMSGVSIVRIVRGGMNINIPGGGTTIYPSDQIVVAGSDQQIEKFKQMLDGSVVEVKNQPARTHVTLERFLIEAGHHLIGVTIKDSHIREKAQCIVIGIERDEQLITNPDPTIDFRENDIVIVAGENERIKDFLIRVDELSNQS